MLRSVPVLVVGLVLLGLFPLVAAEDPTSGSCDRVPVPLNVNIGFVCARAGAGTNAACSPSAGVPIDPECTSLYSWSWLAYSGLELAGDVTVRVRHNVQTCLDLVGEPPACTDHAGETTETCAWDVGEECRGSGRVDEAWGPVHLEMGEQFKVLVHVDIHLDARSHAQGVPIGEASYGDFSDSGAVVEVVDDGRG